ncbi:hypothetical protein L208DRAFT_1336025 [Tricholoma matsutake]|nr:hypothetical protein L208DRAFT_1336025 [Tricholoma matsutake 945]
MGRRKIEIQPIVVSSSFQSQAHRRKHGLFKKAYELGVLCSVDIAIIIIEQRPGRDQRLYEYCSKDIGEIINRRLQGLGEIDTRGPSDYALAVVDGNMDDAEEEDGDGAVGSPVLLKSLGIKRGWENEQPKVRATVSCHFSFDILPIYFVYPG